MAVLVEPAPVPVRAQSTAARLAELHRRVAEGGGGAGVAILRALAAAAALPYGLAVRARNAAFDRGWLRALRAGAPVVSVGNLTTGGTGKTPVVALLAAAARAAGRRPAILMRGYRRGGGDGAASDEVLLYARLAPGVPVVADPDRVRGAAAAVAAGADLLLLDDGFQHRRLARDVDVVLVDARDPFGGARLLPRGHLREPLSGFARAHVLVATRADRIAPYQRAAVAYALSGIAPQARVLLEEHRPVALVAADGALLPLAALSGQRVVALSGIGDPRSLAETLAGLGAEVAAALDFGDHHEFDAADRAAVAAARARHPGARLVTTEKDWCRGAVRHLGEDLVGLRIEADCPGLADAVLGLVPCGTS